MQDIKKTYYAHGKLLLTAEYFVLHGAKAIALPLQHGQRMDVSEGWVDGILSWKAFMQEGLWFSCDLRLSDFEVLSNSDQEKATILQEIFRTIKRLNPDFRLDSALDVHTRIDFNNEWGLGSSSTLIANIAEWAGVNAYRLNELIFNGSGFDIACAKANGPIFYRKDELPEPVNLDYPFLDHLYLVYSGSKKSTRNEVRRFLSSDAVPRQGIIQMDRLTELISKARELADFQKLIAEHEKLVSALLHIPPVKSAWFSGFDGEVKSLGAWGGDFYLVATRLGDREVLRYFKARGLRVVFPWKELVLNREERVYSE